MKAESSWPHDSSFLDISGCDQISDGRVRCTAVAVCDDGGQPCRTFHQGQTAHFFYEFLVVERIGIPSGGLQFENQEGKLIHGKNSFQCDEAFPSKPNPGNFLRYHHSLKLEVEPGEYRFEVGCASTDPSSLQGHRQGELTHLEFSRLCAEHCRVPRVGSFVVRLREDGKLSHYGIANLPGTIQNIVVEGSFKGHGRPHEAPPRLSSPTVFHITHWKAGSQWIHKILREAAPDLIIKPQLDDVQFLHWPIQRGKIYPTLYLTKYQFETVRVPEKWKRFVIIRDLRDTLVSAYFSLRFSHPIVRYQMAKVRSTLNSVSQEEAFIFLMDEWLPACAKIQLSWLEGGEEVFRYEDLLSRDVQMMTEILIRRCDMPITHDRLDEIVKANRFHKLAGGREPGDEDPKSHYRKGISGDWMNYFTPGVKSAFKARYGGVLIAAGYEKDLDW